MSIISRRGPILVALAAAVIGSGAGIEARKPSSPAAPLAAATYHSPLEANAALVAINKANPALTALHRIATSPGGVELTVLEIGPEAGTTTRKVPAVFVVANLEGVLPLTTEAALALAERLTTGGGAAQNLTWFILPNGNPDAAGHFFRKPLVADERNASKWNDDMDDQTDEDGPDDLDGNGLITAMRVKDPAGEWIPVEGEPRLMRKADRAKGEKGIYKLYTEGIDNDGDGEYNEDPPGGTNISVTFPHLFHAWTATGGRWPGSEPETFGIMKFAMDHPEIAMTFAFGSSNLCLQPPAGGRQGSFDASSIKIPERMAPRLGADPNRTYSMQEIIDMVRPLAPPGFEITEGVIASFLGLGAVVNPLEDDLKFYKELSDQYKEFLKTAKLDAKRIDPAQPKDGSFELWSYYQLGVPVFSMDLWTLPDVKADDKEKTGITPDSLEAMTPDAFVALGEARIAAFLKEVGAPDSIKPAMLVEGVKTGKMTPKQMAGMLKQMPKPKDASGADPKDKALLAFSDKELQGRGYVNWTAFKHPTLGEVEIGGMVPFADTTPPASMVKPLVDGQVPWVLKLAEKLPRLRILKGEAQAKGAGIYALTLFVENAGYLPFPTAMGRKNLHVPPAIVSMGGKDGAKDVVFLSGRARMTINEIDGGRSAKLEWLVQVPPTMTGIDVSVESANAGGDRGRITLGGGQGGAK
jgi:Zinc carboxypeptidase